MNYSNLVGKRCALNRWTVEDDSSEIRGLIRSRHTHLQKRLCTVLEADPSRDLHGLPAILLKVQFHDGIQVWVYFHDCDFD